MRSTHCLIVILAAVWSMPNNVDGQGVGRGGVARGVGGYPGGPAIGGFGGGVGGRTPGNRFGGNLRNSPTFRPAPSLTPQQTFRPYPSLSPGLNFNPPGSLFRPQRGGANPPSPAAPGNSRIVGLPHASRLVSASPPLSSGGDTTTAPSGGTPVIRIGSLGSPDQIDDLKKIIDKVLAKPAGKQLFTAEWFAAHENSWHVPAIANHARDTPEWLAVKYWLRIEQDGFSYFYGTNVVHRDGEVRVAGKRVATTQEFRDRAREIAAQGQRPEKDAALWMPLGVFALVRTADAADTTEFVQLSVDMDGLLRGTMWNGQQKAATLITGAVDPPSQRTVWSIGEEKGVIFEAGIFNLTGSAVLLLVHATNSTAQHALLVRLID